MENQQDKIESYSAIKAAKIRSQEYYARQLKNAASNLIVEKPSFSVRRSDNKLRAPSFAR